MEPLLFIIFINDLVDICTNPPHLLKISLLDVDLHTSGKTCKIWSCIILKLLLCEHVAVSLLLCVQRAPCHLSLRRVTSLLVSIVIPLCFVMMNFTL